MIPLINMIYNSFYKSKLGLVKISYDDKIRKIEFTDTIDGNNQKSNLSDYFYSQVGEYLSGKRKVFEGLDLLGPTGTDFQRAVWDEILKIPYGKTSTYKDLARAIKNPRAFQAVGSAVGKNPIAIIIPCHRVIKSDGSMGGFAYGEDIKRELLKIEGVDF